MLQAACTLLQNTLPALPEQGAVTDLWEEALSLSYSTELRTERKNRANELVLAANDFYATVTRHHATSLGCGFTLDESTGVLSYRRQASSIRHLTTRVAWSLRRVQGKILSVLRVLKALFTFEGGLDYIAWKLARHSGENIVIPDQVRRAPLIYMWGYFWGLYRRGIFK